MANEEVKNFIPRVKAEEEVMVFNFIICIRHPRT